MKTRLIIIAVLLSMFCTSCVVVENGHRHRGWGHRHDYIFKIPFVCKGNLFYHWTLCFGKYALYRAGNYCTCYLCHTFCHLAQSGGKSFDALKTEKNTGRYHYLVAGVCTHHILVCFFIFTRQQVRRILIHHH